MAVMPEQKPGNSKQDVQTPPEFLAAVKELLCIDEFSIDLAASAENAICPLYFDKVSDSLKQNWNGLSWQWLNPEFADIEPWVMKAYIQTQKWQSKVAVLVPLSIADWWKNWVDNKAHVLLLHGRITFVGHSQCYPKDCALLLYGQFEPGYEVWSWKNQK